MSNMKQCKWKSLNVSCNIEGNKWPNSACLSQRNCYLCMCACVENMWSMVVAPG